jgi:pantoate--beta-alanine ligase
MRRLTVVLRERGRSVALVPTMGALHEGHLSLVRRAKAGADRVVASVFVNPLQFGPSEDFARYPRDAALDFARLVDAGVDAIYAPTPAAMYPEGFAARATVPGLDQVLEGASRPGHFTGVCTVVLKLVHAVAPDVLWLGQKDAQQCVVLEHLLRDLDLPVVVRRAPTVREPDGLALSSRNAYLSPEERAQAPLLAHALFAARDEVLAGERDARRIRERIVRAVDRAPLVRLDYAEVVEARTLRRLDRLEGEVLIVLAARVGRTRLIDNVQFRATAAAGRTRRAS